MNQNTKYRNCCFVSGPVLSPCLLKAIQGWSIPVFVQPPTPYSLERIRRIEDSEAVSLIGGEDCVVIMNWEASLSFIVKNLPSERLDWVNTFKNKAFFRELVKDLYPDLFYVELTRDNLLDFEFPESVDRVVIKPCLGTASIGIRMVEKGEEWGSVVNSVLEDIDRASENMNSTMLNDSCFVVEEFVEGDEFACDGFWDGEGKTVITGIYQHPFASSWDVSDTVYYTSVDVVVETIEPTKRVLEYIGDKLGIKRFPFHFEFRRFDNKTHNKKHTPSDKQHT
ncbi:MAG: ATP-grasp domain-containing protein [Rivularia sp. ALOHA_DT_140]|nr:ATP-grasp domain-containing protein [Rivularia sp. ALOHA_DT_140]